jgi:hypothetical protein
VSVGPVQTLFGAQEAGQLGKTVDLEDLYDAVTAVAYATLPGDGDTAMCSFEGSHDGRNWHRLTTMNLHRQSHPFAPPSVLIAASTARTHLWRYARVNLVEVVAVEGGTVEVSATIAAK